MLLSIDPGISTGVAVFNRHSVLIHSTTLEVDQIDEDHLLRWGSFFVVIESTPTPTLSAMNRKLAGVTGRLKTMFPAAEYLLPGVWKGNVKIRKAPFPEHYVNPTQHQLDAYRMGLYYMKYKLPLDRFSDFLEKGK